VQTAVLRDPDLDIDGLHGGLFGEFGPSAAAASQLSIRVGKRRWPGPRSRSASVSPGTSRAADRESGSGRSCLRTESVDDVDSLGRTVTEECLVLPSTPPRRPLLDDRQLHTEVRAARRRLLRVGFADGDLALLPVSDGDVTCCSGPLTCSDASRGGPEHRAVARSRTVSGARPRLPCRECVLRLGSSERPVTVDQYSRASRTAFRSSSSSGPAGRARTACDRVEREVVRREDLAERDGCRVFAMVAH